MSWLTDTRDSHHSGIAPTLPGVWMSHGDASPVATSACSLSTMNTPVTRRTFLKTTTAASALAFPAVLRAQTADTPSPNNRLNVAIIGAGGRGGAALVGTKDENIVAICDVDEERADGSLKSFTQRYAAEGERFSAAPRFNDYRKMFDQLGNKIDAVTISIPDHGHYPAAMTAMGLGKH